MKSLPPFELRLSRRRKENNIYLLKLGHLKNYSRFGHAQNKKSLKKGTGIFFFFFT